MKNSSILTIVEVSELKQDKNERNFKTIRVSTPSTKFVNTPHGQVEANIKPKTGVVNVWEENYLDKSSDFGFDLKKGDVILGDIITAKVEPYEIPNKDTGEIKTVNTFSCVVLGDSASASFPAEIERAFTSNEKIVDGLNLVAENESVASVYEA